MLSVDGKIIGKSLFILKPTNWSDYVFGDDYRLMDLDEVKAFIKKNHHLPGLPSAHEIHEKGYDVNEMNALLLKKIEELYLYIIELKKQLEHE